MRTKRKLKLPSPHPHFSTSFCWVAWGSGEWGLQTVCNALFLLLLHDYFLPLLQHGVLPTVFQLGSSKEQFCIREAAYEYIQCFSLFSKSKIPGSFSMNMIDWYGFLMIANGNLYNKMLVCSMQISEQITKYNQITCGKPRLLIYESVPVFSVSWM